MVQTIPNGHYRELHSKRFRPRFGTTLLQPWLFLTPEGESHFYDKRHLFRIGMEGEQYTAGNQRPIITYKGWHILLLICYDLRFPVWSRNVDNEYDLLIYVASWPSSRRSAWDILLQARAQENLCYTCGVNRIGTDGNGLIYTEEASYTRPREKCWHPSLTKREHCHRNTLFQSTAKLPEEVSRMARCRPFFYFLR